MKTVVVNLPFPGFYESMYSGVLDRAEENEAENQAERETSAEYYPEEYHPEYLRINATEYCEIFMRCADYGVAYRQVAEWYVEAFDAWAVENLDTPKNAFKFESMDSPREYNFTTDRVYSTVRLSTMRKLFTRSAKGGHELLASAIKARFTSRDGFISGYDNDVSSWVAKPLDEWDHNELGTLLLASIGSIDEDGDDGFRWQMFESTFGDEGPETAFIDCVDWVKFDKLRDELRAEKLESAIEDGLIAEPADVPYRCPFTLELPFAIAAIV